jgi:hypothetical protein
MDQEISGLETQVQTITDPAGNTSSTAPTTIPEAGENRQCDHIGRGGCFPTSP